MRDRSTLARLRLPILGLIPVVLAAAAVITVAGGTQARPPLTPSPIPEEAFKPLIVPESWTMPSLDRAADRGSEPSPASPSPSAAPSPASAPPAGPVHIVRPGDTLWEIAAWHAADVAAVLRWNAAADPGRLVAGQQILVPDGAPMVKPKIVKPVVAKPAGVARLATLPASGRHVWPLAVRGTITTTFSSAHPGIDVAAPAGTRVRAVAAGTVIWAGWKDNGGGFVVILRHPDGMISTYNHNRDLAVERGQRVAAGEAIASVGSSGWSTGPHLDFRIEMGGQLIDPLRFF